MKKVKKVKKVVPGKKGMSFAKRNTHMLQRIKRTKCVHCELYIPLSRQRRKLSTCCTQCQKNHDKVENHIKENQCNDGYNRRPSVFDIPATVDFGRGMVQL